MPDTLTRRSLLAAAAIPALRLPKKIRIGIAGMEGHVSEILKPIEGLPDVELVSVSDSDPAKMAKLAPAVRRYSDYIQMLDKEQLDVVGIGGANHQRAAIILACAERKLHVAAEKPLAIERADLERIRQAVRQNRRDRQITSGWRWQARGSEHQVAVPSHRISWSAVPEPKARRAWPNDWRDPEHQLPGGSTGVK